MGKVDVADYYKFAANNIDDIHQLIRDAAEEGGEAFCANYAIDQCLNTKLYDGTLEYLAAVAGLPDGVSFNEVVQQLIKRHLIRNQLGPLWPAFHKLPEGSVFRDKMISLLRKAKYVSYADVHENYPKESVEPPPENSD